MQQIKPKTDNRMNVQQNVGMTKRRTMSQKMLKKSQAINEGLQFVGNDTDQTC